MNGVSIRPQALVRFSGAPKQFASTAEDAVDRTLHHFERGERWLSDREQYSQRTITIWMAYYAERLAIRDAEARLEEARRDPITARARRAHLGRVGELPAQIQSNLAEPVQDIEGGYSGEPDEWVSVRPLPNPEALPEVEGEPMSVQLEGKPGGPEPGR